MLGCWTDEETECGNSPKETGRLFKHSRELPHACFPMRFEGCMIPSTVVFQDLGRPQHIKGSVGKGSRDQSECLGKRQGWNFFLSFRRSVSRNSSARIT